MCYMRYASTKSTIPRFVMNNASSGPENGLAEGAVVTVSTTYGKAVEFELDEDRSNFGDGSENLRQLIKSLVSVMNSRIKTTLAPGLVQQWVQILRNFGIHLKVVRPQPHSRNSRKWILYYKLREDCPAVSNVPELFSALSSFELELIERQRYVYNYKGDNIYGKCAEDKNKNTLHKDLLSPLSKAVRSHNWDELGRLCGSRVVLRSTVNSFTMPFTGNKTRDYHSFLLNQAFYQMNRVYSTLYLNAMLQRLIVDHKTPISQRSQCLLTTSLLVITTGMKSTRRCPEQLSWLILSMITLMAWREKDMVSELARFKTKFESKLLTEEMTHFFFAFKNLQEYLTWNGDVRNGERIANDLLRDAAKYGDNGSVLVEAACRIYNKCSSVTDYEQMIADYISNSGQSALSDVYPILKRLCNEEDAQLLLDTSLPHWSPDIHQADTVWIDWCELRIKQPDRYGGTVEAGSSVVKAMVPFLDYAENGNNGKAWILLWHGLQHTQSSINWSSLWDSRKDWWPLFHKSFPLDSTGETFRSGSLDMLSNTLEE